MVETSRLTFQNQG